MNYSVLITFNKIRYNNQYDIYLHSARNNIIWKLAWFRVINAVKVTAMWKVNNNASHGSLHSICNDLQFICKWMNNNEAVVSKLILYNKIRIVYSKIQMLCY